MQSFSCQSADCPTDFFTLAAAGGATSVPLDGVGHTMPRPERAGRTRGECARRAFTTTTPTTAFLLRADLPAASGADQLECRGRDAIASAQQASTRHDPAPPPQPEDIYVYFFISGVARVLGLDRVTPRGGSSGKLTRLTAQPARSAGARACDCHRQRVTLPVGMSDAGASSAPGGTGAVYLARNRGQGSAVTADRRRCDATLLGGSADAARVARGRGPRSAFPEPSVAQRPDRACCPHRPGAGDPARCRPNRDPHRGWQESADCDRSCADCAARLCPVAFLDELFLSIACLVKLACILFPALPRPWDERAGAATLAWQVSAATATSRAVASRSERHVSKRGRRSLQRAAVCAP